MQQQSFIHHPNIVPVKMVISDEECPRIGLEGAWNDLEASGNPDPNNPFHPQGYVVEFGGMPGDPIVNLSPPLF